MSKLMECCINITDGEHGSVKNDLNGEYYLLSNKNINNGKIIISEDDRKINRKEFERINARTKIEKDDILISTVGTLGKTAIVKENINYTVQRSVGIIKVDKKKANPIYIKYQLDTNEFQNRLVNLSKGAVQKCLFIGDLKELQINLPKLDIQNKVADTLNYIDLKIENNNKINSELESMAKTIYDYWFLQFEFPNEEGKPYKSSGGKMVWNEELGREIPEGWEVRRLESIESNIVTGKTPSTKNKSYYNGKIPFITIGDIRGTMHVVKTAQTLSLEGANSQKNKYIPSGAICVTCIASPGLVGFASRDSQTNQQINSVVCKHEYNKMFLYYSIENYFKFSSGAKTGNTFDNMNKNDFASIKITYPSIKELELYHKETLNIYKNILNNSKENEELISLRDFLLPLLMNGQVGFKENINVKEIEVGKEEVLT